MTETMPETSSQPGLILKTAREEMSLSVEQVAQELHLRPAVIKALEEENYSEFNSNVFLKGYFRTYCRLVKLHEDRMVEILDKQLGHIKEKAESALEQETKALLSRKRRKTFVTLCVFLVCAGLIAFTYYLTTSATPETDSNEIPVSMNAVKENTTSQGSLDKPEADETNEPLTQTDDTALQASEDAEVITTEEFEQAQDLDDSVNQELASDTNESPISERVDTNSQRVDNSSRSDDEPEMTDSSPQPSDTASVLSSLYAVFSGDCWFKLTDGTGKTVIADLKTENEEVNYQGIAPFHIVIGDASKVSLVFEGESIDLAAYSSPNGRAELKLNAKDAESQGE